MSQAATDARRPGRSAATLAIVVPVFNEQESIRRFLAAARPAVEQALAPVGGFAEFIFVDDGSSDGTFTLLRHLADHHGDIRVVRLSRNFGKEAALAAGLRYADAAAVIPMDVDLQDPPHLIGEMVAKWRAGAQVVNAKRCDRTSDKYLKRKTARGFYSIYNRLAERPIPDDVGDFRLLDRRVVETLNRLEEGARFNKGLFSWVGFATDTVEYVRAERAAGESKWRYWRLWKLALDGITASSTMPLRVWTYVGALIALASLAYAAFLVARTMISGNEVPGYTSTIVAVLFLGGLNLLSLGIMGEYVGRIANEVRRRPLFVVDRVEGF
ncbi:MAG: glycosyltransferase family 2 protein [Brucellaceae bacterium]|nr:glycosyltransferase family 2 protein [Brucellaceae bacterium]